MKTPTRIAMIRKKLKAIHRAAGPALKGPLYHGVSVKERTVIRELAVADLKDNHCDDSLLENGPACRTKVIPRRERLMLAASVWFLGLNFCLMVAIFLVGILLMQTSNWTTEPIGAAVSICSAWAISIVIVWSIVLVLHQALQNLKSVPETDASQRNPR